VRATVRGGAIDEWRVRACETRSGRLGAHSGRRPDCAGDAHGVYFLKLNGGRAVAFCSRAVCGVVPSVLYLYGKVGGGGGAKTGS